MKIVGVYKIENKFTGECYVGSSRDVRKRWNQHRRHLLRNKHHNYRLQAAYDLHGPDAFIFEILEHVEAEQLIVREQFFMDLLRPQYNIHPKADGSQHAEETKALIRAASTGKKHSEDTKARLSAARMGKKSPKLNTGRGYCQWTNKKSGITYWRVDWTPAHGCKRKAKIFHTEPEAAAFVAAIRAGYSGT